MRENRQTKEYLSQKKHHSLCTVLLHSGTFSQLVATTTDPKYISDLANSLSFAAVQLPYVQNCLARLKVGRPSHFHFRRMFPPLSFLPRPEFQLPSSSSSSLPPLCSLLFPFPHPFSSGLSPDRPSAVSPLPGLLGLGVSNRRRRKRRGRRRWGERTRNNFHFPANWFPSPPPPPPPLPPSQVLLVPQQWQSGVK